MALTIEWIAGVFVVNTVLGVLLVLALFTAMERQFGIGALVGIIVGSGVIYGEATLGEQMLDPSVSGMKVLVIVAALGAVIGVVGAAFAVEPEL